MQLVWSLTAIFSLFAILLILIENDPGARQDEPAALTARNAITAVKSPERLLTFIPVAVGAQLDG
jgi:hypothetical protein